MIIDLEMKFNFCYFFMYMNRSEKIFTYKIYEHCVALLKKVGTIFDDW